MRGIFRSPYKIIGLSQAPSGENFRRLFQAVYVRLRLHIMENLRRQLQEVEDNEQDILWLRSHQEDLYKLFTKTILKPPLAMQAIDILCRVYRNIDTHQNPQDWRYILSIALEEAQILKDTKMQADIYIHISPEYLASGEHSAANEGFLNALLQKEASPEVHLMATLGLIKGESLYHKDNGSEYHIKHAETLIKQVTQPKVIGIYREAMALTHLAHGDLRPALENALMAVCTWQSLNNAQKMIDSIFILADTYRYMGQLSAYAACLDLLMDYVDPKSLHDYALLNYHRGTYALHQAEYLHAIDFYQIALDGFKKTPYKLLTHSSQQALALAFYCVKDMPRGDLHMKDAIDGWKALDNDYQVMDAYRTQGFGYHKNHYFNEAVHFYEHALNYRQRNTNAPSDLSLAQMVEHYLSLAQARQPPP